MPESVDELIAILDLGTQIKRHARPSIEVLHDALALVEAAEDVERSVRAHQRVAPKVSRQTQRGRNGLLAGLTGVFSSVLARCWDAVRSWRPCGGS